MRLLTFNKFSFIKEHLLEGSEFNQYQFGIEPFPLGPGYGFAKDPSLSIYSDRDSPYVDYYARSAGVITDLLTLIKSYQKPIDYEDIKYDHFLEDVDDFKNFKILRLNINESGFLDVFISFELQENEFFGAYKNFNWINKTKLVSELFTDPRYKYIDADYYLKIDNYFYKILENWFKPGKGYWKLLKEKIAIRDDFGKLHDLKEGALIKVVGVYDDENNKPYITIKLDENNYYIDNNNYYFFKYWFEKQG